MILTGLANTGALFSNLGGNTMRYLGKATLDRREGRFNLAWFLVKVCAGFAFTLLGTLGWLIILDAIVNGGR